MSLNHDMGEKQELHLAEVFGARKTPGSGNQWLFVPLYDREGSLMAHAVVDREDFLMVSRHRWFLDQSNGYASTNVIDERGGLRSDGVRKKRRVLRMHCLLLDLHPGSELVGDHINRDRLDNRRSNLRAVTRSQNSQNRSKVPGTSSRFRGVTWEPSRGKWAAQVGLDGKNHRLGRFDTEEEAAEVAGTWRREHMPYADAMEGHYESQS